jgi:hypothetical protein
MSEQAWIKYWLRHRAHIALLLLFAFRLGLPVFDSHAAEYVPWHQHIVQGAYSQSELRSLLASHHHSFEQTSQRHPASVLRSTKQDGRHIDSGSLRVIAIVDLASSPISVSSSVDLVLFMPGVTHLPAPVLDLSRLLSVSVPINLGVELSPPAPPPRAAGIPHPS